jgi:hypothetical protein
MVGAAAGPEGIATRWRRFAGYDELLASAKALAGERRSTVSKTRSSSGSDSLVRSEGESPAQDAPTSSDTRSTHVEASSSFWFRRREPTAPRAPTDT